MTNITPHTPSEPISNLAPAATSGEPAPVKKKSSARFITPILALVAAIGIGLFGGVLIGQNTASATTAGTRQGGQGNFPGGTTEGAPGGTGTGTRGNFTSGTVASVDGDVVTLTLTDGSTVKVTATDDTTITTTETSKIDALAEGDTLTVVGTADADGNVAATSISEGATGFGGGMGGGGAAPTGSN